LAPYVEVNTVRKENIERAPLELLLEKWPEEEW